MGREGRHYLGHRKRLRERFRKGGAVALRDDELLELLLGYAIPRRDTKPLAKVLMAGAGSLRKLVDSPLDELESLEGVGEYTATLIKLVKTNKI